MSNPQILQLRNISFLAALRQSPGLASLLLVFISVVLFVNPIREMVTHDDGFAYARTVRHLLETGEFRLDAWAAANMPAQIFFSASLSKLFGYSLGLLIASTLIVLTIGLISFYLLLRDFGSNDRQAAVLTLGLLCSPPVLLLSFSFMTDVQFMGWIIMAKWLYARAITRNSLGLMLLASFPATAAIGTRQFGLALLGGLFLTWLLFERRLRTAPLLLVGLLLPLLAASWQIWAGVREPNFTQLVRLGEQSLYMSQDMASLLGEFIWRSVVVLEHIGIFLVPLLPAFGFLIYVIITGRGPRGAEQRSARSASSLDRRLPAAWAVFVSVGLAYSFFNSEWVDGLVVRSPVMPSTSWLVEYRLVPSNGPAYVRYPLTLFAVLSAIGLGWLLSLRYANKHHRQDVPRGEIFIALTGLVLLLLHLVYVQINDTYTIAFLPFVLFVLAQLLRNHGLPRWWVRATSASCLAFLILSSLAVRASLEKQEAVFTVAERLRTSGVDPMQIKGDDHWNYYHSAFDHWISEVGEKSPPGNYTGPYRMHIAFYKWLDERLRNAKYTITDSKSPPSCEGCSPGGVVEYRSMLLRRHYVYATLNVRD